MGEPQWSHAYPLLDLASSAITSDGASLFVGGSAAPHTKIEDVVVDDELGGFVAKFDAAGQISWGTGFEDHLYRRMVDLALGPGGEIVAAGHGTVRRLDAEGKELLGDRRRSGRASSGYGRGQRVGRRALGVDHVRL